MPNSIEIHQLRACTYASRATQLATAIATPIRGVVSDSLDRGLAKICYTYFAEIPIYEIRNTIACNSLDSFMGKRSLGSGERANARHSTCCAASMGMTC